MWAAYEDIVSRIATDPLWWDECGTPRYDPFTTHLLADIYAGRAALLRIACQACGRRFDVAMSEGLHETRPFAPGAWHYGDPPRHDCSGAGESMNCDDLAVLEAWERGTFQWVRYYGLEGDVP